MKIEIFSDFQGIGYNRPMGILENIEYESSSLDIKIYSETCCNGCTCQSEDSHKKEGL